ncbi:MAG: hypothetical protein ABSA93_04100 [Streptosporangiaceae bacterium]|jgi:hypothetical protein
MNEKPSRVTLLTDEYRDTLFQWHLAHGDPPKANKLFRRKHALVKEIRGSAEGRAAIEALLDDPEVAVRMSAAADSLAWRSARGEAVLEAVEQADGEYAFDAKWTLRSYRAGKLNLDW